MSNVLYKSKNNIAYICLNKEEKFNALDKDMLEELLLVVEKVEKSDDQIVIISGKGKAFCAGGDIAMMADFAEKAFYDAVMEKIETIIFKLYMMPKIVISAVQGSAVGLGLSLALTADYVVAEEEARFGLLFIGIGLAPDGGGHFLLRERLGTHQAKQFTWSKQQVKSAVAKEMGLVDVVTNERAVEHVTAMAEELRTAPIIAMLQTKMIYHHKNKDTLQDYLAAEREAQWELRNTADHQEGVQAFLEKRKPVFKGK